MNVTPRALLSFKNLPDAGLLAKTETIINAMTANPHFPTPEPAIAVVTTANTAYGDALKVAKTGTRADSALKNQQRDALEQLLTDLAAYVNFTAKGDRAILLTSGFDITSEDAPPVVTKPASIKVVNGKNPGELASSVPRMDGGISFSHEYTLDPELAEKSWQRFTSTKANFTFTGLEPGKTYFVRVGAVGSKDQTVYSDVISRIVI